MPKSEYDKVLEQIDSLPKKKQRIENALLVVWAYGQPGGEHHLLWIIDQMVRALTEDEYDYWCEHMPMEEGIAP